MELTSSADILSAGLSSVFEQSSADDAEMAKAKKKAGSGSDTPYVPRHIQLELLQLSKLFCRAGRDGMTPAQLARYKELYEKHVARVGAKSVKSVITIDPSAPVIDVEVRAPMPDIFLRSALFALRPKRGRRARIEGYVECWKGWKVWYSGDQLDQLDLDVVAELYRRVAAGAEGLLDRLEIAATTPDFTVSFSPRQLLKSLHKDTGGGEKRWLERTISRLRDADLKCDCPEQGVEYHDKLLGSLYIRKNNGAKIYSIRVPGNLVALFGPTLWTGIHRENRFALRDYQPSSDTCNESKYSGALACFLHGFMSSHRDGFSGKVATLHRLSGSNDNLRSFRQRLGATLTGMKNLGVVSEYDITLLGHRAEKSDTDYAIRFK